MADLNKMDRTWLCSVVFMDIVKYSSQSVELEMKWKKRFNGYLAEAIQDVPESERVILDTGDGAAICFLGAPEAAMFTALQLCRSFVLDEQEQQPGLRVRLGINLGPVKLIKDINGNLNAIGDGINAGQRIMSFASENKILVSQSFFEVVSRLSDDYKRLFQLKGVEKDKHVREHTVYHLVLPGSEKQQDSAESAGRQTTPLLESASRQASPAPEGAASTQDYAQERPVPQGRSIPWLVGGAALVVLAAAGVWLFYGPIAPATNVNPSPIGQDQVGQGQTSAPNAAATATAIEPTSPAVSTPARPEPAAPSNAPVPAPELAPEPLAVATPPAATPQITNVVVSDGMPFTIALAADVRSDADIGRPLRFTAVQDIRVRGVMVIPKGAAVTGQISETAKKKFLGIGAGKLSFELLKAETAGGQQLGIRALSVRRDDGATQRPLETNTHTGSKDIAAAQGARYIAYVDGEQTVAVPQK